MNSKLISAALIFMATSANAQDQDKCRITIGAATDEKAKIVIMNDPGRMIGEDSTVFNINGKLDKDGAILSELPFTAVIHGDCRETTIYPTSKPAPEEDPKNVEPKPPQPQKPEE